MAERPRITIPLDEPLLDFIEQSAERDCRTVAGQARFFLETARRREEVQPRERAA
jgi:hypothetical protein